ALWIICDRHILYITTGNIVISDILAYFSFMSIPIGFVYVVYHLIRRYQKVFIVLEILFTTNIVMQTFLFATGIVDIASMLIVSHILMIGGILIVVVLVAIAAIKHKTRHNVIMGIAFSLFSILMGICLVGYIAIPGFNYNSFFLVGILELILAFCYLSIAEFIKVITKNHYMQQTIKYAYIDVLTGIGNRRAYEDYLSEEKRKIDNNDIAIIGCDVNFLKKSNDTLGHQAGDELLVATAKLLKDVFGENVFRVGGDEFSIIVNSSKDDIKLNLVALKYKVQNWSGNYNKALSLAIGFAVMADYPGLSVEQLSIKADEQMYKMKKIMHENESMGLLFNE
nr:GGDEF domain-containing protein [Acholeplasmatales bacterium]